MSADEEIKADIQDIFFDYDTYDIRSDAQATLSRDASFLVSHPDVKILIGGYCDERGSNEYNLALGQNRADAAKNALIRPAWRPTAFASSATARKSPFARSRPRSAGS